MACRRDANQPLRPGTAWTTMRPRMSLRELAVLVLLLVTSGVARPVRAGGDGGTGGQAPEVKAREIHRRAMELERRGDPGGALALLWTASGLDPSDADIHADLADALQRVGALDAAIEAWRAAVAARPDQTRTSRGLVLALVSAGRSVEAVTLARAARERAPDDPEALVTLGLAYSEQDVEAAMGCLTRALARSPQHTLARYNLALLYRRVDRLDDAIAELQQVAAVERRPEVLQALGAAWWHRGEAARATEALLAAIAADDRHADAHQLLGVVRAASRDWNGAALSLRRAIELRPRAPETHVTLARVLRAAGDDAAADRHAAEGERLRREAEREQEARVWTSMGTLRLEQGEALSALDAFRRAIGLLEAYAPAHFQMGRALDRLGDREAADGAYARAQALNPRLVPPRPATRP